MKDLLLAFVVLSALVVGSVEAWRGGEKGDLPERDETHETFELAAGATVDVSGIDGSLTVETAAGRAVEVRIVRSARTRADLAHHRIVVERAPSSLRIHPEREHGRGGAEVFQRVWLKLPRDVSFSASGINGGARLGAFDGPVAASGINGSVEVEQATGYSTLSGINGSVTVTIARLGERGISVSGINGSVELRFADDLDADLEVSGISGNVNADVPNVVVQGKVRPSNFRARIGAGGPRISISGVNGSVRLTRAAFSARR